jgi:GntR family transcriptional regulator/MocR family aminotransferase
VKIQKAELVLDPYSKIPLGRQLADQLRRGIIEEKITLGSLLPSVRDLAQKLKISRSTVTRCFDELAGQGYISVVPGSGTSACKRLPGELDENRRWLSPSSARAEKPIVFSEYAKRLLAGVQTNASQTKPLLNYGGPPLEAAPVDRWRELLLQHIKSSTLNQSSSNQDAGFLPLRKAYSGYLARTRAIRCDLSQVFVFVARELRLDLLCRLLIDPGDNVAVENPGYPGARSRLAVHGANVLPISVDSQGLNVDELIAMHQPIKLVYLTPSHHEPTGVVMPLSRRRKLLKWAQETGAILIEDDYDSEFRYDSRPMPSLMSLDDTDSVVHISCLWKTLSPVSKLGFMIVPKRLVEPLSCAKLFVERETPALESLILTDYIEQGHLERIISKNRKLYSRRRECLVRSLKKHLDGSITMSPESAGMDLFVRVTTALSDMQVLERAASAEMPMVSAEPYYAGEAPGKEFIIPFSLISEERIESCVKKWAQLLLC